MNLFLDNGHLTDEGLQALIDDNLDEMQRLEVSEHLSFCDECLVRYTDLLTDPICMEPEHDLVLPVMQRLRKKALRVITSRYATAAAAVVLTLCLWAAGFFSGIHAEEAQMGQKITQNCPFSGEIQQIFWQISNTFSDMMNQVSGDISDSMQKDKMDVSNNQSQKSTQQENSDKRFQQKGE